MKKILLVRHVQRPAAIAATEVAMRELAQLGITVVSEEQLESEVTDAESPELVLAMGGDGTILAAAESARRYDIPLLGINAGHMGFLAEASPESIPKLMHRLATSDFEVEKRSTLDVSIKLPGDNTIEDWALNDAVVKHTDPAHPVHLILVVDGQDVSTYGADGMILSTPTGSTAYSFSAGGPVVWPDTEAVVISPIAAHGLFTRPLVVGPSSTIEVFINEENWSAPEVWCDGHRRTVAPSGTSVIAKVSANPVRLVRMSHTPFSERLVTRFNLPVRGWRTPEGNAS